MKRTNRKRSAVLLTLAAGALLPTVASAGVGDYEGTIAEGDFDGDGEIDLVVSSPEDDCGKGVIHIRSSSTTLSWTRTTPGVLGVAACNQYFGTALAVGDFDADGYDDLAVSAPGASDSGETRSGTVHVFYGSSTGLTTIGDQLWHQDTTGINGVAENYDYLGDALDVGDFDCDGYDDLAIGVPREGVSTHSDAGAVQVFYGSAGGVSSVDDIWHESVAGVDGVAEAGDHFGGALAAGNFNGDSAGGNACDDLAIASPGEGVGSIAQAGYLYVMDGGASGLSTTGDQSFHQNSTNVAGVAEPYDRFGERLVAFDADGDQFEDLAIAIPGDACVGGHGEGRQVIHGGSAGIRTGDDEVGCDDYRCWVDGSSYRCPSYGPPVRGGSLSEDFEFLVGDDRLWAGSGDDWALGDRGDDVLFGGDGDDHLRGGPDADMLIGGPGDDTFEVGLDCEVVAGEVIDGGPGNDTVLSHLSRKRLQTLGVTIRSVENFVSQAEDLDADCDAKPWKVHPSDIASVDLDQNFYAKTDEIVLDIATHRSDLTVWADFSAVDSAYVVGDETLTGVGTEALQLRYQLSGSSSVEAGNVRLPIEVRDTGGRLIHRFGVALKYAPSGVPSMVPQSGVFRLAAHPSRPDSGWRVQSAVFVSSVPPVPDPPQFDFSTTATIPAAERTLEVTLRAPQSAGLGDIVQLELGEKARDGTFAVLAAVQPSCTPVSGTSDCDYVIEVGFDAATGDAVLEPLDIRILDAVGGISPSTELPLQAEGVDPAWARVEGRVQVRYLRQEPDTNWDPDAFQTGTISWWETFPLPHGTHVRLNLCGQVDTGTVDINGDFSLAFFTNCLGEDDGFVEVFSSTGGTATNRIAVGAWNGTPNLITSANSLTDDPDDYAVYVVRVGDGLEVDDAIGPGGLDLGEMIIEQSEDSAAVAAFVGMRGVVDTINYADGLDGVDLLDLPSVNILADEDLCLSSSGFGELDCYSFGGETQTGLHPGFFYVQDYRLAQEWVYAHEWGHVFHSRMLRGSRKNEFNEPYANMIAQSAITFAGRAEGGWAFPLGGVASENMDFNGKSEPSGGQTEQVALSPFFASTTDAAAVASQYGCDDAGSTQDMGNCVMSQSQGAVWRIYWDLHDGSGDEPIWNFVDDEGTVTSSYQNFDQVDGGSNGGPGGHAFHNRLLGYVASAAAGGSHPGYQDRGQTDLDLVDVLDGMTCGGMGEVDAEDLLLDVHGYDYDFDPPEPTCN